MAKRNANILPEPAPITSPAILHLAGVAMKTPERLTAKEIQRLAASVEAHAARQGHVKPERE